MGLVSPGIPQEITLKLSRLANASVFVETGTFTGNSARWAAKHFEKAITIERAEGLFNEYSRSLRAIGNVEPLLGDSRTILPSVVEKIGPTVFWLDGHWSGGQTSGQGDECPLLEELAALSKRTGDIVLIDDARLFLHAPPEPHNADDWPTITEVVHAFDVWVHPPHIQVIDDVIFAVPEKLRGPLTEHARVQRRPSQMARLLSRLR